MSGADVLQRKVGADFSPLPEDAAGAPGRALAGAAGDAEDFAVALDNATQQKNSIGADNALRKGIDDLKDQFRSDPNPDTMAERFTKAAGDLAKQAGAGLSGRWATQFQDQADQAIEASRVGIKDLAFNRTTSQLHAAVDDNIETNSRAAANATNSAERAGAIDAMSKAVNGAVSTGMMTAEEGQKKLQTAKERLALFDGKRAIFADPRAAQKNLANPSYLPELDPLNRVELQDQAESQIHVQEREKRADLAQARLEAGQAAGDLHDVVVSGLPVAQEVIDRAQATAAASGDPRAMMRVAGLMNAKGVVDGLRGASPRVVDAKLAEMEAQANKSGANEAMATALTATRKFSETQNSALTHDPLMWAADQGVATIKPLALNGSDAPADFSARIKTAQDVSSHYGVPFQPLTAAESHSLETQLQSQNPDLQLGALQWTVKGFGSYTMPILEKLGAHDPVISRAGALIASGDAYKTAARDALTGSHLLSNSANGNLRPTLAGKAATNASGLMGAYSMLPDELSGVKGAADAIYAARAARQGLTGADILKGGDAAALYDRALQEAAGARYDTSGSTHWGGITQFTRNGHFSGAPYSVLVPSSVKADGLEDVLHSLTASDLGKASGNGAAPVWQGGEAPADLTRKTWLFSYGNGIYGLSATSPGSGIQPVQDKTGKPFHFNFNTAMTVMRSRLHSGGR